MDFCMGWNYSRKDRVKQEIFMQSNSQYGGILKHLGIGIVSEM